MQMTTTEEIMFECDNIVAERYAKHITYANYLREMSI